MTNFLSWLLGTWSNKHQAQSAPTLYKSVTVKWEQNGEFINSIHWGRKSSHDPYLKTYKKLVEVSDREVILEHWGGTYSGLTRNEECDMVLKFDGTAWMGQFDTDNIHAELAVYGTKLFMRDKFLDSKGRIVWGADEIYKFVRV
ncbi:antenna protein [Prochlorococcus phage P-SSM7]|uniref:Antenna protein n=1 Tax=Prochlorococcus phage P-SSM7 TaxID=445688 RepID=E3SP20_9CAUD|nr:CpeT-like antenna protein [Prochlorococcus phage P-SSM7]ADO99088.1 antenna protein [Prochlorococcus phage P-SSM7]